MLSQYDNFVCFHISIEMKEEINKTNSKTKKKPNICYIILNELNDLVVTKRDEINEALISKPIAMGALCKIRQR